MATRWFTSCSSHDKNEQCLFSACNVNSTDQFMNPWKPLGCSDDLFAMILEEVCEGKDDGIDHML